MSKLTTLASGQVNASDAITMVLAEPEGMPSSIIIHWPSQPTVCHPRRFPEVGAIAMRVLAQAVTRYNPINAARR